MLPLLIAAVGLGVVVPASDSHIRYEGRTAVRTDGSVDMGFPGVTVHVRVLGSGLRFTVEATKGRQYIDVGIDDGPWRQIEVHAGRGTYALDFDGSGGDAASTGVHTISLVRCNESWQGTLSFKSFAATSGGELLDPPALPERKLMFVGDSVTCGEMTTYHPGTDFNDPANTDARVSYGMLLARRFQAQCYLVSYGGRGVIRDWQGIHKTNNAPQFYELALPDDPETPWDHRKYVPDAIGVQLGTNDFSSGIPDEVDFVNTYVTLVHTLRRDAPGAFIFLMESPILDGEKRAVLRSYLEEIVSLVRDPRVRLAPLVHRRGVPGNGHPTGAEHQAMADELAPRLKSVMGW
jgi:hypothetical protein